MCGCICLVLCVLWHVWQPCSTRSASDTSMMQADSSGCEFPPSCGTHGTINAACGCDCDSGWATAPNQDLSATVYCGANATIVSRQSSTSQGGPSTSSTGTSSTSSKPALQSAFTLHDMHSMHALGDDIHNTCQICSMHIRQGGNCCIALSRAFEVPPSMSQRH